MLLRQVAAKCLILLVQVASVLFAVGTCPPLLNSPLRVKTPGVTVPIPGPQALNCQWGAKREGGGEVA